MLQRKWRITPFQALFQTSSGTKGWPLIYLTILNNFAPSSHLMTDNVILQKPQPQRCLPMSWETKRDCENISHWHFREGCFYCNLFISLRCSFIIIQTSYIVLYSLNTHRKPCICIRLIGFLDFQINTTNNKNQSDSISDFSFIIKHTELRKKIQLPYINIQNKKETRLLNKFKYQVKLQFTYIDSIKFSSILKNFIL